MQISFECARGDAPPQVDLPVPPRRGDMIEHAGSTFTVERVIWKIDDRSRWSVVVEVSQEQARADDEDVHRRLGETRLTGFKPGS